MGTGGFALCKHGNTEEINHENYHQYLIARGLDSPFKVLSIISAETQVMSCTEYELLLEGHTIGSYSIQYVINDDNCNITHERAGHLTHFGHAQD